MNFDAVGHSANSASANNSSELLHLPYAQFQIPFSIDHGSSQPNLVELWVSTDGGSSWQQHGSSQPNAGNFPFRAAAEGLYLFSVRTVDSDGKSHTSNHPPLRVNVDTTKPVAAMRADIDATGKLVIDLRVMDANVNASSAELRFRTDREATWQNVIVPALARKDSYFETRATADVPTCREIALVFTIKDQAGNPGEATYRVTMPRTAQADADLRLASVGDEQRALSPSNGNRTTFDSTNPIGRNSLTPLPGAMEWKPDMASTAPAPKLGHLTSSDGISLNGPAATIEELPLPSPAEYPVATHGVSPLQELQREAPRPQATDAQPDPNSSNSLLELPVADAIDEPADLSSFGQAYHCKSRAFSLDYSVDSLAGAALADVELWGTEDGGREWQQWGSDPDRLSPFDVQVGNDGLFGFRMVIVGANGVVSNRPKNGDTADVWINVDTVTPSAKITRAVYGEGPEMGMLVIDYQCSDLHLVDRPISLAFSERPEGPWSTFVSGQKNTGIYLWKASPTLPDRIYLKVEAVDKAGNIGSHQLDLPIDTKGLAPRGRIHGFRPIAQPGS